MMLPHTKIVYDCMHCTPLVDVQTSLNLFVFLQDRHRSFSKASYHHQNILRFLVPKHSCKEFVVLVSRIQRANRISCSQNTRLKERSSHSCLKTWDWKKSCCNSRVASAVDIIDQLLTTFKICLCSMYIENFLDYPSQLYLQRNLQDRQEQLKK